MLPIFAVLASSLIAASHLSVGAQKPPQKTKGTAPMAGGLGTFGQTYKIATNDTPMNFTVLSASYSVATFNGTENRYCMVDVKHKLLIIHYSIENPTNHDMYIGSGSLFQVVDSSDQTIQDSGVCRRADQRAQISATLKPGQELKDLVTYVVVPADTYITKLILQFAPPKSKYKVIRYMIGGKYNVIKPLPAPFADPKDKLGRIALAQIPSKVGATYTCGLCDFSVDSISLAPGPFGNQTADNGKQFLVAKVTATNKAWLHFYFNGAYKTWVKTEDDKIDEYKIMKASTDEAWSGVMLEEGDTTTHRLLFQVPKSAKLKTLTISIDMGNDGMTRQFIYDLAGVGS